MPYRDPDVRRESGRMRQRRHRAKVTARSAADKRARIDARPVWPVLDLAWAAGLFEGEGTTTVVRHGPAQTQCLVTLSSTDREVIDWLTLRWPGSVKSVQPKSPRARLAWVWTLYGERMVYFLLDIQPHLRRAIVRRRVAIVIEAPMIRRRGSRDPSLRLRLEGLRAEIAVLNRRGVEALTTGRMPTLMLPEART